MNLLARLGLAATLPLALLAFGCSDAVTDSTTSVSPTPAEVLAPEAPGEVPQAEGEEAGTAGAVETTTSEPAEIETEAADAAQPESAGAATTPEENASDSNVKLTSLTFEEFESEVLKDPNARYIIVDAWATNCGPCKENFPHLVEMYHKYHDKGLKVVSLSLDDPTDADVVEQAREFLRSKGAVFTNVLLNEEFGVGYERLDINAIPAVFLYNPQGELVKRFTMDDPDNQFTYEQVEEELASRFGDQAAEAPGAGE